MKNALLLAAGLSAAASPVCAADTACVRIGQIYDWKALDNSTLIVEDTFHNKVKVELLGSCINLKFKQRIGFSSPGGTSLSCLSAGDTVFLRDRALGEQRCAIKSVSAYTPQMEKADKEAEAAKKAGAEPSKDAESKDQPASGAAKPQ